MGQRKEHVVSAAQSDNSSDLCAKHPAKQSGLAKMAQSNKVCLHPWRAYFEDLELFCGAGFIRSESVEKSLTAGCADNSNLPKGISRGISAVLVL